MQAGANFKHILELTFKQQIFMICIVDYFYQNEFLKIKKKIVHGQSFKGGENVIHFRNEGISSCNLSINPLKRYMKIGEMENPAGKNPHCKKNKMHKSMNISIKTKRAFFTITRFIMSTN